MQKVVDWLKKGNSEALDSPPASPCYDFPLHEKELEDDGWETPPEANEEEEEDEYDNNITIVPYEPDFSSNDI